MDSSPGEGPRQPGGVGASEKQKVGKQVGSVGASSPGDREKTHIWISV